MACCCHTQDNCALQREAAVASLRDFYTFIKITIYYWSMFFWFSAGIYESARLLKSYSTAMVAAFRFLDWNPVMLLTTTILPAVSAVYTCSVPNTHIAFDVPIVIGYLYWVVRSSLLIIEAGAIFDEFSEASAKLRNTRWKPKRMKNHKVRRPRVPFYKRGNHRKTVRLKKEAAARKNKAAEEERSRKDALSEKNLFRAYLRHYMDPEYLWIDDAVNDLEEKGTVWLDDNSSPPTCYWKYLHRLPYAEYFDGICKSNPDLPSLLFDFAHESILRSATATTTLLQDFVFTADSKNYNLTAMTQTNDLFRFQSMYHTEACPQGAPLVFDSGASITISPYKEDFVSMDTSPEMLAQNTVTGFAQGSETLVKGIGTICVLVHTDNGDRRYIETEAYWIPQARTRLLSVCRYQQAYKGEGCRFSIEDGGTVFTFPSSTGGGKITFDSQRSNNIPKTTAFSQEYRKSAANGSGRQVFMVLDNSNVNLTPSQKALLKLHFCLGHFNLPWIQKLIAQGVLETTEREMTSKNAICNCMACQLAKQTRRPEGVVHQKLRKEKDGNLKKGTLRPGAMISSDQFVSSLPGRLPNTYGKEKVSEKFVGGTVFIDEASGLFTVELQVSLGAAETIRAKNKMEREAIRHGIAILGYRADNGVYKSKEFNDDLKKFNQTIIFSGVGAHHHNGIAERGIRTISTAARAILIHAMIHWPDETALDLWPFAVQYAVYLWNRMPQKSSGLSPIEIFYNTKSDHSDLKMARCWGCPAYVLDPTLQDGKKLPRWSPRSKLGQFLGRSDKHSSTVGLIRNCKTNAVTAQFHVVYDDHFSTMDSDLNHDNIPVPENFNNLMKFSRENAYDPDDFVSKRRAELERAKRSNPIPAPQPTAEPAPERAPPVERAPERAPAPAVVNPNSPSNTREEQRERVPDPITPTNVSDPHVTFDVDDSDSEASDATPAASPTPRRSSRVRKTAIASDMMVQGRGRNSQRYFSASYLGYLNDCFGEMDLYDAFIVERDLDSKSSYLTRQFEVLHCMKLDDDDPEILHAQHPFAFAARANVEDTPRFHEAMSSPDREGFIKAMNIEIEQLNDMEAFVTVPRQKAIDEGRQVIECTWAFKRKRYPDGTVKKLKARLCVRGDLQELGVDVFDTYSPVVQWSTIRLLLILSVILKLETKQVDYTLAFVQAKAEPGIYIEMPKMFEQDGCILELKRNLYGQRDAPLKFYEHLRKGFEQRGFHISSFDPCLFLSDTCICLTYVDDCIFMSRRAEDIDSVIDSLKNDTSNGKEVFLLEVEDDYAGFLGIDISESKTVDGAVELLQTGLIDRILAALNLDDDDVVIRTEPASSTPLTKDESGPPRKEHWSYASIIGMLLYLSSNSRPDITYAVNSCARFTHCARESHEKAVKRIARYLKGTRDKGLIFKPDQELKLDLYADADFAGLWNPNDAHDPISVKSRTGFIVTLGGVPVTWSSKLQTEIATSTLHAEYVALSTGMRDLIPIADTLDELCKYLKVERTGESRVIRAFEDNEGALTLANSKLPKTTPRTKHFAVKYHWFREKLEDYNIKIVPVRTDLQEADIFTKGLDKSEFRKKRLLLMGW